MIHSFFGAITVSSFLAITRNSDTFFNCPAKIEALFIASPAFTLSPARAVDRFSAVYSVSARSLT